MTDDQVKARIRQAVLEFLDVLMDAHVSARVIREGLHAVMDEIDSAYEQARGRMQ